MTVDRRSGDGAGRSARSRRGDRVFAGLALAAGITILLALAGVFVFLAIEGLPGLDAPPSRSTQPATDFRRYVAPLVFGTILAPAIALIVAVPFAIGVALFISPLRAAPARRARSPT